MNSRSALANGKEAKNKKNEYKFKR